MSSNRTYKLQWLTIIFVLVGNSCWSQPIDTDSLWNVWKDQTKQDTVRLIALRDYAWEKYLFTQSDSAFYFAEVGYQYAKSKGLKKEMASLLNLQGASFWYQGNYSKAIHYYTQSLDLKQEVGDKKGIAGALLNLGNIYSDQGNYAQAIDNYTEALKVYEQFDDKDRIADCLNNIGIIYQEQDRYEDALKYHKRSLKLNQETANRKAEARALSNIGISYFRLEKSEEALDYYQKSLAIRKAIEDNRGIATCINNIGKVFTLNKKYDSAFSYYQRSLEINRNLKDKFGMAVTYNSIGDNYKKQKKYVEAIGYSKKTLAIGQDIGHIILTRDAAKALYESYKLLGESQNALNMHELYMQTRDSIASESNKNEMIHQEYKYEYDKQKIADSLSFLKQNEFNEIKHQADLAKQRHIRNILILGIGLLSILGIIIYGSYRRKKKDNIVITQQKLELTRKNEEKTAMLKEIHHRVKNNLQVVNSLLKFQSKEIEDDRVVSMFKDAQNRVLSMALLHEKLYRSDDLRHIDAAEHIELLVEDLVRTYMVGKTIKSHIEIEAIDIGINTLVPLGLIVNEIITNALKYAFVKSDIGGIYVKIYATSPTTFEMIIGDDGIGWNPEHTTEGIGEKLINAFVKQLKGTITRLERRGTFFKVMFLKID